MNKKLIPITLKTRYCSVLLDDTEHIETQVWLIPPDAEVETYKKYVDMSSLMLWLETRYFVHVKPPAKLVRIKKEKVAGVQVLELKEISVTDSIAKLPPRRIQAYLPSETDCNPIHEYGSMVVEYSDAKRHILEELRAYFRKGYKVLPLRKE